MGPYCKFCGSRCFLPRAGAQLGTTTILATCRRGMAHDLKTSGYTHRTAINPVMGTRDELADARYVGRGFTLNARIAVRIITDLMASNTLTAQAIACLAGVPEAYAVDTHRRAYN
jgi:hypothetical protein